MSVRTSQEPARRRGPSLATENDVPREEWLERAVICAVLREPTMAGTIRQIVAPHMFHLPEHSAAYELSLEAADAGTELDHISLGLAVAKRCGWEDREAVNQWAWNLQDALFHGANGDNYAREMAATYKRRMLSLICGEAREKVTDPNVDVDAVLADTDGRIKALTDGVAKRSAILLSDSLVGTLDAIDSQSRQFLSTGFSAVDGYLGGLRSGQLIVVGARPSMGKTAFALNLATNVAKEGHAVGFFSLEMSVNDLNERLLSRQSRVPLNAFGHLTAAERHSLCDAASALSPVPLVIDDASRSLSDILSAIRQMRRKYRIEAAVVDYIGLVAPPDSKAAREQQVATISREFKGIARELGIALVVCAQLNRLVESRQDKTPVLSDLRESGAIEQDADVVMFLHRPNYYDTSQPHNRAVISVAKQRQGPVGRCELQWRGEITAFSDIGDAFD